jgi:hypothetical protein
MRINPFIYGFLVLTVFLGAIYSFQAAGIWSVSGKVDAQGQAVLPEAADVTSIKGWMTLEQICTTYGVSLDEIIQTFNLPADISPSTAVKDLESDTFSVDTLREWLAERSTGETTSPQEEPGLPKPTPAPTAAPTASALAPESAATEEHVPEEFTVTAQTSFQDLLDWGVTQETIERILGGSMPPASMGVKDYVTGQGLKFSEIKNALQAEVDQVK